MKAGVEIGKRPSQLRKRGRRGRGKLSYRTSD